MALVHAYDPGTNTITAELGVKRRLEDEDDNAVHEDVALIQSVPVQWPGGGGFELRFPLAKGDSVLLVFSMWADSVFMATGQPSEPVDATKHGLSYAKAIPLGRARSYPGAAAQLIAPSPFTVGDLAAAHLVALSNKVDQNFQAIKNMFSAWTPAAGDGGAALKGLSSSLSFGATAAAKLKSE